MLAGGSQQTASIGAAVIAAHRALVKELLKLAGNDSPLAGLDPDEVGSRDGGLCKLDESERHEELCLDPRPGPARRRSRSRRPPPPPLETLHWSMHSHGAMFCEVRVNAVTGETACQPLPGLVRLRPHPQSEDGGEPVPRRHHHGAGARADGGDAVRRAHAAAS